MPNNYLELEFDRQLQNLVQKKYPLLAGVPEAEFIEEVQSLKPLLANISVESKGSIPLLIVIKQAWVPAEKAMTLIEINGQPGIVNMTPLQPQDFSPISEVNIPETSAYLLIDVQTGQEMLNVTPAEALKKMMSEGRTPLTIDEGVSLLTQFPETLTDKEKFNAFSMLASRRNDKRVPAIWISYVQPRLGWCWNENPHTWLGSASAKMRVA